jgi:hypothetical protein
VTGSLTVRGLKPGSVARVFRRYGDWMPPAHARGLGDPLAEATVDEHGEAFFADLQPGLPLWLVGEGYQGPIVRRTYSEGDPTPRKIAALRSMRSSSSAARAGLRVVTDPQLTRRPPSSPPKRPGSMSPT